MLNNLLLCAVLILLLILCGVVLYCSYIKTKYKSLLTTHEALQNRYSSLELNYTTLERAYKAKQEVHNDTTQKLETIAAGSIDDSIERLQKRNRKNGN